MIVVTFMRLWLSSSWCGEWLCCLNMTFWFSSLWCDVYLCLGDSNKKSIFNKRKEIKLIVELQ